WRQADHLLGTAAADVDDPVLTEFLTARVRAAAGDTAAAEALLGRVLARRPDHDGAREALVELLSESGRVDEALTEARGWASRVPDDPLALVTLSGLLRRAGRAAETSDIAARLGRVPQPAGFVVRELAEIDLETGRPADVLPRLDQLTALPAAAQPRLDETRAVARVLAGVPDASPATPYARHCAACHGDGREPRGPAAPDLFPAARDFRTDAFRLVTSPDGQPSAADVAAVIRRGIPGTSMPGFPELDAEVVAEIVAAVLGQRQPRAVPATAPGSLTVSLPGAEQLAAGDAERGRKVYARSGCATCHGPAGSPVAAPALFDERGLPTLPRDLVHEPFKGGRAPADVAARLALGMPGSPHPAVSLAPSDLADLVAHVRALEGPAHLPTTNHQRLRRATGPAPTAGR
ncbi:MAG: c-type cytochrome, partial [Pirellulales bacterium]